MKILIRYAGGGGGNWLSHTVANLQNNTTNIIQPKIGKNDKAIKFDFVDVKSKDIKCIHFDYEVDDRKFYILGSKHMFNTGLAGHTKNNCNETDKSLTELFDYHSNLATHFMYGDIAYKQNIDLYVDWLYNDKLRFCDKLYEILDENDITYTKNTEFVLASIDNYLSTMPNINEYFDNWNSMFWLGWCHAVIMKKGISIDVNMYSCNDIECISNALLPHRNVCIEEIQKHIIPNTVNFT